MKSKRVSVPKKIAVSVCAALIALALTDGLRPLRAQLLGDTSLNSGNYSGQATVINITDVHAPIPGPIIICDTGPLPPSGGFLEASVMETNVANGALTCELARATTRGDGPEAISATSVNNFYIEIMAADGTISTLRAHFISSEAVASCEANGRVDLNGGVLIEGLVLNGKAVKVARRPNQVEYFPGGRVIINEQTRSSTSTSGDMTVVAIHILVDGCMNASIGFAHADVTCSATTPPSECDKLTGGGWIVGTPSGEKGTFGVSGGIRRGEFWGHLNYIDHGTGLHVRSQDVTGYAVDPNDSTCRIIDYNVDIDGSPGTARVRACDKGEPGRDDIFEIQLSNGYFAGGDLGGDQPGGGNIQLHKCPPGWQ